MSEYIKREDVLAIIEGRFSGMMIGDILKQDINALPAKKWNKESQDKYKERNRQIYEQRMAGKTFSEIALNEGLSAVRVRQIYEKEARLERLRAQRIENAMEEVR